MCEETTQEKWGEIPEKTKQNNQQSSHLTRNHVRTSQTGVPHNTMTLGRVLQGYYPSARETFPWTKDCYVPTPQKRKNKPQKDQMVPKEFICVPEQAQKYLKQYKHIECLTRSNSQCLASNQKLLDMQRSRKIQPKTGRKVNQ